MRLSIQAFAACMVIKHSQKVLKIVSRSNEILAYYLNRYASPMSQAAVSVCWRDER